MIIYFVRHGEGEHNAKGLYSLPDFELTEKGIGEAKAIGARLKHIPLDLFVISEFKRTRQTAGYILEQLDGIPTVYSDLCVEIKRPSEIAGKELRAPENLKVRKLLDEHLSDPSYHYSDEENFFDLKKRAEKFLDYLEKRQEENICVVSHSVFIKMVILVILAGENLNPKTYADSFKTLFLATSGLTVCKFEEDIWSLITWNDQSHLGE